MCVFQVTFKFVPLKIKGKQALPLCLLFDGEIQHLGLTVYHHLKTALLVYFDFLSDINDYLAR